MSDCIAMLPEDPRGVEKELPFSDIKGIESFAFDPDLLPRLSSKEKLQDFLQEQLLVLICQKGKMPSEGGIVKFRMQFIESLVKNYNLKHDVANILGVKSTTAGLFLAPVLADEVNKLEDKDFMNLLVKLEPANLFSLQDLILSSSKPVGPKH